MGVLTFGVACILGGLYLGLLIFAGPYISQGIIFGEAYFWGDLLSEFLQYFNLSSFSPKHVLGVSEVGYFVPFLFKKCTFVKLIT